MRLTALACTTLLLLCPAFHPAAEEGAKPTTTFVNHTVSTRRVAVNQPVRLEFTTMPRQVEGVDIATTMVNGIELAAGATWRLLGKPTVKEHEKTRTITVTMTLLPRVTGDLDLPRPPLAWLAGDPRPDFGLVTVAQAIAVGTEQRPLPAEYDGVGGYAWGTALTEVADRAGVVPKVDGDRTLLTLGNLVLVFRGGLLAEARIRADDLPLNQARASFLERWGMPLSEEDGLTWSLGWTRIVATESAKGTEVHLTRDDLAARVAAAQVKGRVFQLLDGGK